MPTIAGTIGPAILKEALAAADGRHTSAKPLVFTDPAERGVSIRVQGKRAGWYLRFNGKFAKLGDVGNPDVKAAAREAGRIYSLKDAVERAGRVREMLKLGMDPANYLAARALGQSHEEAASTGISVAARRDGAWTLRTLGERFLAEHISVDTVTSKGRVKAPSAKTINEVARLWREADVAALGDVLLRDLTRRQIESVRNSWYAAGRYDAQRKMVTYIRRSMSWAREHHEEAGLGDVAPWWLDLKWTRFARKADLAESRGEALPQPLTAEQVAKLLFTAEVHRVVPGRKIKDETSEITLAALWWVALTAQRTHAAYGVTIGSIEDRTNVEGWYDVAWAPAMMKARRQFALPVPPEVYDRTLGRALQSKDRREPTMWVFPSPTLKDRGKDSYTDRPLGDGALNSMLRRLRGKDRPGQPDLLADAGLPHFTLHELRDSLATYLADTQLPASTASAILDHAPDGEEPAAREAAVTREYYNKSQHAPEVPGAGRLERSGPRRV